MLWYVGLSKVCLLLLLSKALGAANRAHFQKRKCNYVLLPSQHFQFSRVFVSPHHLPALCRSPPWGYCDLWVWFLMDFWSPPGRGFWQTEALWWPGASVVSSSLGRWRPFWQRWFGNNGQSEKRSILGWGVIHGCTQQYLTIKNKSYIIFTRMTDVATTTWPIWETRRKHRERHCCRWQMQLGTFLVELSYCWQDETPWWFLLLNFLLFFFPLQVEPFFSNDARFLLLDLSSLRNSTQQSAIFVSIRLENQRKNLAP